MHDQYYPITFSLCPIKKTINLTLRHEQRTCYYYVSTESGHVDLLKTVYHYLRTNIKMYSKQRSKKK